eukprot:SAG31_NODE_19515_length_599_cov_1.804000_2_plen_21_part_01
MEGPAMDMHISAGTLLFQYHY